MFTKSEIKKAKESPYSIIKLVGGGVYRGQVNSIGTKKLSGKFYRCHADGSAIAPAVYHNMTFLHTEVKSVE